MLADILREFTPKSEEDTIGELKEYFESIDSSDTTLKEVKKNITKICQPFDYDAIVSEILNKTGIIYSNADIKKLISLLKILNY